MDKEKDNRLDRLWYVKDKPKSLWTDWSQISSYPHIFLTNAPLSFGHSQLIIPSKHKNDEATLFQSASEIIVGVLRVCQNIFGKQKIQSKQKYEALAANTYSYGKFIKTLVLRTSANEKHGRELKIHFVPYFESNQTECHKRFHSLHTTGPDNKGGLIGWLGERETQMDKWLVDGFPGPVSLDKIGRDVWKLPELAKQFHQTWARQPGAGEGRL